jgi:hypothetical protein
MVGIPTGIPCHHSSSSAKHQSSVLARDNRRREKSVLSRPNVVRESRETTFEDGGIGPPRPQVKDSGMPALSIEIPLRIGQYMILTKIHDGGKRKR